jgi:hypothetical protein
VTPQPTIALQTFTSPMYGFSFDFPASWESRAATAPWAFGEYVEPELDYVDSVWPAGRPLGALAGIASQPLPKGMSREAWLADWAERRAAEGVACRFDPAAWTDTVVGGAPARRIDAPCSIETGSAFNGTILEAAWVIDRTGYVATGTATIVEIMLASFVAP